MNNVQCPTLASIEIRVYFFFGFDSLNKNYRKKTSLRLLLVPDHLFTLDSDFAKKPGRPAGSSSDVTFV